MNEQQIIDTTILFVKEELKNAEGGHDWFHIERVFNNAKLIAKGESATTFIIELGALLHDIADSKFHNGDETVGPKKATQFLLSQNVDSAIIEHVVQIIKNISFKGGNIQRTFSSIELDIVQDADRLDAIGAIGIARAFIYGGYKNNPIYDPELKPNLKMDKETYKKGNTTTINHFYEKLLKLKNMMNTSTGKQIAEDRHRFMLQFLEQFYREWDI